MAKINTLNYQTVAAWNGSQDLFVVEQPDGTKVATPEQVKQYVLNDMDEVPTQNSNNPVKSGGIFSTMAVPKYDATNRREYYEGGAAFDGNIDSSPTAGSNNAVSSGGTKTYVDSAVTQLNSKLVPREISLTSPMGTVEGKAYVTGGILLVNAYVTLTSAITNNNGHILTLGESVIKGSPNWVGTNFIDAGIIRGYGVGDKIYCQTNVASGKVLSVALAFPIN